MSKPTLIFDFDGTLADTFFLFKEVLELIKVDYGHAQVQAKPDGYYRNQSIKQLLQEYSIKRWQMPGLIKKVHQHMFNHVDQIKFFPELKLVLNKLLEHGFKLGIMSSNNLKTIQLFLRQEEFSHFEFIYAHASLFGKHRKLRRLLRKEQLEKSGVIYFGDQVRDVEACHKIKIPVAAVSWGFNSTKRLQQTNPTYLFTKPKDLLTFF